MIAWHRATLAVGRDTIATFAAGASAPDAPVVLLVHGLAHWTEGAWTPLVERMPAGFRVVALDLPGFGDSSKPDTVYDMALFARAVDAVVATIPSGVPIVAIGHSLGGMIAADLAARRPDRLAGLVLIDPAGFLSMPAWLYGVMRSPLLEALMTRVRPNAWYVSRQVAQSVLYPTSVGPENRARWVVTLQDRAVRRTIARVYAGALQQIADIGALHRRFAAYTGPTFVVWGRYDRYIPVAALAEARRVYPQAETLVCDASAHCPAIEEPDLVASRVDAFLRATNRPSALR